LIDKPIVIKAEDSVEMSYGGVSLSVPKKNNFMAAPSAKKQSARSKSDSIEDEIESEIPVGSDIDESIAESIDQSKSR
jgi:hypothetical protein